MKTALDLWNMVCLVTPEEFHRHEDRYDNDSGQGRELLFLIANHEWVRATSEIVNIGRSDAIETSLKVDIDLSQITHEAFRGKTGRLWLPVTVLPLQKVQGRHEPDPFATVTDAAGNLLPLMPADDLGHQMSAGLAEIIVNMAIAHLPPYADENSGAGPGHEQDGPALRDPGHGAESHVATREERVLLSAAVHRLLRHGSKPVTGATRDQKMSQIISDFGTFADSLDKVLAGPRPTAARFRITDARYLLQELLAAYIIYLGLYATIPAAGTAFVNQRLGESQFAPRLAYRAVRVLQALVASTIIAVPLQVDTAPTVLTVRVPERTLRPTSPRFNPTRPSTFKLRPSTWQIRPTGHLEIDVLLPTSDADRQIQVYLADGISFDDSAHAGRPDRSATASRLEIAVGNPSPVLDLSVSMDEVLRIKDFPWPPALSESLVDLARAKAALVYDTLRHYDVRAEDEASPPQNGLTLTKQRQESLTSLAARLPSVTRNYASLVRVREFWHESGLDRLDLLRRTSVDPPGPGALVARVELIEDVAQRATPQTAMIHADVRVADNEYFSITRTSTWLSLIVMTGILLSLIGWHILSPQSSVHPEVLAIVLTLFATVQASRIERPDRSTLQGRLSSGTGILAGIMLPPVALAIALAFQPAVLAGSIWAGVCIAVQFWFLVLMEWWWSPREKDQEPSRRKRGWVTIGDRRRFETGEHPDYSHFEVLRSDYWRNTTADALMVGRAAYGYVIRQGNGEGAAADGLVPPQLESLLAPDGGPTVSAEKPGSVLALLHSSTQQQAITFVVFREKRDDLLAATGRGPAQNRPRMTEAREFDLEPDHLAPMDNVTSNVDIFIGQHGDFPVLESHPLVAALEAAKGKLIVPEALLPFPPPMPGYPDLQWARMRVALRDAEDIRRLTDFLQEIYVRIVQSGETGHVVAVQADPTVLPRNIGEFVTPTPGARTGPGEDSGDLHIPPESIIWNEGDNAKTWRMVASCAPARSNIESDIIAELPFDRARFQLAHMNYALLHGMAFAIVLLHDTGDSAKIARADPLIRNGQQEPDGDPDDAYWSQPGVVVDAQVSRAELGPFKKCQLLHIQFRWQDRPGAFFDVLNSIDLALASDPPGIRQASRSVSYARLYIATGRIADGDLTVRMHTQPQGDGHWGRLVTGQLARKIGTEAAFQARVGDDSHGPGVHLNGQNPIIRIELLGQASSQPGTVPANGERPRGGRGVIST